MIGNVICRVLHRRSVLTSVLTSAFRILSNGRQLPHSGQVTDDIAVFSVLTLWGSFLSDDRGRAVERSLASIGRGTNVDIEVQTLWLAKCWSRIFPDISGCGSLRLGREEFMRAYGDPASVPLRHRPEARLLVLRRKPT